MIKAIKEIIIMLLICLISMLILAVVLYDYIPNKKVVAEVTKYSTSEEIETQLADDIDSEGKEVVLTYEVTSKELNSYKDKDKYVPGKLNPFAEASEYVNENSTDDTNENTTQTTPSENNTTESNTIVDDGGIK